MTKRPDSSLPPVVPPTRKANVLETVQAVGAAFFGVRGRKSHERDAVNLNPVVVIAVGVIMTVIFVLTLLAIVKMVVK